MILSVWLGAWIAAAPARAAASTFTVSGYIEAALGASAEVQQAAAQYEAARALWKSQIASAWMPTVGFSGKVYPYGHDPSEGYRYQHWGLNAADMSANTSLNINLFNSFSDYYKVRQTLLARDTAQAGLSSTQQTRVFAAMGAFYELSLEDRLFEVAQQNLKAQEGFYVLTKDLYEHGMKSLADLLKSETDWHSSEIRRTQASSDRKLALVRFNLLIGRPADEPVLLATDLESGTTDLPNLSGDVEAALSRRPEAVSARLNLQASEVAVSQARRDGLPQLALNASWNRSDNGRRIGNSDPNPNYQVALSLALPSGFNGAAQWFNVSAMRAKAAAARQNVAALERQIRSEVHSAHIALERALAMYRIATIKEGIARRNLDLVEEQYRQGSADIIRFAQAQLDNLQARVEQSQARHDAFLSRAQYRLAIGELLWK